MKVLVINGSNINMLGIREKDIYGTKTYDDLKLMIFDHAREIGADVEIEQSNHEGELIDTIQHLFHHGLTALHVHEFQLGTYQVNM